MSWPQIISIVTGLLSIGGVVVSVTRYITRLQLEVRLERLQAEKEKAETSRSDLVAMNKLLVDELASAGGALDVTAPQAARSFVVATAARHRPVLAVTATSREAEDLVDELAAFMDPGEVAETILLCVENGAINGQGINIDGGAVQS